MRLIIVVAATLAILGRLKSVENSVDELADTGSTLSKDQGNTSQDSQYDYEGDQFYDDEVKSS